MTMFGPQYPKIDTMWKRDPARENNVIPGKFARPEFEFLKDVPWRWTEKVDGANIRLHYHPATPYLLSLPDTGADRWYGVRIGGRTDEAQIPPVLRAALDPLIDPPRWEHAFPDVSAEVTVYGEGYGAGIQKDGRLYRDTPGFIVFGVRVGQWWLGDADVADVAAKLGLDVVPPAAAAWPGDTEPHEIGPCGLHDAWDIIRGGKFAVSRLTSQWPGVRVEGMVGRPVTDLLTASGERIITKIKVADWTRLQADWTRLQARRSQQRADKAAGVR